jgi:hypothetical protein
MILVVVKWRKNHGNNIPEVYTDPMLRPSFLILAGILSF